MARQTRWDLALGLAGILYLAMVLFAGIEVPIFGLAVIALSAYALVRAHRAGARR